MSLLEIFIWTIKSKYKVISQVVFGTDQTLINFLIRQQKIELKYLPISFNLQDLHSKQLLYIHPEFWFPDELIFENCGWVFHFNGIPQNNMNRGQLLLVGADLQGVL